MDKRVVVIVGISLILACLLIVATLVILRGNDLRHSLESYADSNGDFTGDFTGVSADFTGVSADFTGVSTDFTGDSTGDSTGDMGRIFNGVYERAAWSDEGGGSGQGSGVDFTENLRCTLTAICKMHGIRSMVDVPCGSCLWTTTFLAEVPWPMSYVGVDVADIALQRAAANLSRLPPERLSLTTLLRADVTRDELPAGPFDLLLCRDTLQHLPLASCFDLLRNLSRVQATFYLIGSYVTGANADINAGEYFDVDLAQPPFYMRPLKIFCENHPETEIQKHLYMYPRDLFVALVERLPGV